MTLCDQQHTHNSVAFCFPPKIRDVYENTRYVRYYILRTVVVVVVVVPKQQPIRGVIVLYIAVTTLIRGVFEFFYVPVVPPYPYAGRTVSFFRCADGDMQPAGAATPSRERTRI